MNQRQRKSRRGSGGPGGWQLSEAIATNCYSDNTKSLPKCQHPRNVPQLTALARARAIRLAGAGDYVFAAKHLDFSYALQRQGSRP